MSDSMVSYVLENRGQPTLPNSQSGNRDANFSERKMLQNLFSKSETSKAGEGSKRRISDLKFEEISGQLNYFSEKLHVELSKKHLELEETLSRLEDQWMKKKIPDFYCYYFLKFAYANTYSRMHELFLSEIEHMSREKDSYYVIKKTIEAREVCLTNLRRQIASVTELDIQESLQTMRAELAIKKKKRAERGKKEEQDSGKSWKNKLESVFEAMSHLRKLTGFVVELIKNWKGSIYGISEDPRRFRERVIFFHNESNYLIKLTFDNKFVFNSFLKKHISFAEHFDPFFMKPIMVLQSNISNLSPDDEVFYNLLKSTKQEKEKMTKALVVLAEEEYDESEQSKVLEEGKGDGELQKRKKFFQKRRDVLLSKSASNLKKQNRQTPKTPQRKGSQDEHQKQAEEQNKKQRIEASVKNIRKIKSIDMKKVSPYLSRNDRIAKVQKVLQLEHKFKVAQDEYVETVKKKKQSPHRSNQEMKKEWSTPTEEVTNNRIFNRYIEENLKLMEEANKKAFLYKNRVDPRQHESARREGDYNRVSFRDRKQLQYERNIEKYQRDDRAVSERRRIMKNQSQRKPVIEISSKGVINNKKQMVEYELSGRKGKNVGSILDQERKEQEMRMIESRLNPQTKEGLKEQEKKQREANIKEEQEKNLYESEQRPEIIIMRQQPEKIEELKQFLYAKIKEELLEELSKNKGDKEQELSLLVEEEKKRRIEEIIEARKREEEREAEEMERMKQLQLEKQRKKIDFEIKVEAIQYAEENVNQYFDKVFEISPNTYHRLFLNQKLEEKKEQLMNQFYMIFLRGFLNDEEVAYCIVRYDWACETSRKLVFEYVAVKNFYHFISAFHSFSEYLWKNDPVDQIQIVLLNNAENAEGGKFVGDIQEYADQRGETYSKQLYSNVTEMKYVWLRPQEHKHIEFPYRGMYFSKNLNFKSELLITSLSMNERATPKIDMNLEIFTNYVFLLEELFRRFLTPEEVVELRESSTNIRRLKDIFRIILELQTSNPVVDELTIVEGLNLDDLYEKMREKFKPPYDRYYWHLFYDKVLANRLLLAILEFKLELEFPINSCHLDDRRFLRINPRRKVLTLKSSVYSQDDIYILNTSNPKIRLFLIDGERYKFMRIELFVFLNLVFNNVVEDTEKYVNSFWVPQFTFKGDDSKEVKRVTDFSITMKKSFFLSEQIYYCNHEYIKNALSLLPRKSDVLYRGSVIVGFLHTAVEAGSTGMPLYAKLVERTQQY